MGKYMIKNRFSFLPVETQYYLRRTQFRCEYPNAFMKFQKKRQIKTRKGYSYKPFDELKCIFVHVPKCAGVYVCRNLFGNLAGGHTQISLYQIIF